MDAWETVSKKAYWDRDVPLDKWREMISKGHRSYLPDAVICLTAAEFIRFYGVERFVKNWPVLRALLLEKAAVKTGFYDIVWSRLAGGGWNLRPFPDFNDMPEGRRRFLVAAVRAPGKCIYEVAKALGMPYRRAHEHAVKLIGEGKLRGAAVMEGGRRKTKLYPTYKD